MSIKRTQLGPGLKLNIKYLGPYRVTRCDPHDRYAVHRVGDGEGPQDSTTAADCMKPWRSFRDDLEEDLESEEEEDAEPNPPANAANQPTQADGAD